MSRFLEILLCGMFFSLAAGAALAQERFIMLIDGSGSMWGQVEGEAKISVLRRNLDTLLQELDTTADVGLMAFGHREKGNCADIEEIVPPSPFDPAILSAAIAGIQPKGKTPLSDAVRQAALSLRFTEEKATVVILGDGRESCGKDPCSVAEELEQTGVDFTVHAIAFDLADEEGTRQLQCFARHTGGQFFEASDSVELVAALEEIREEVAPEVPEVTAAPEPQPEAEPEPPEPAPSVRLVARVQGTGEVVPGTLEWTFINDETEDLTILSGASGTETEDIAPGEYEIIVQSGDAFGETRATVRGEGVTEVVVEVALAAPQGLILSRDTLAAGEVLEVKWGFEGRPDDILFIAATEMDENRYPTGNHQRHVVGHGPVARLVAPASRGRYEVRYFSPSAGGILYRENVQVTSPEVTLQAGREALAGDRIEVSWTGPQAPGDLVFVAPINWAKDVYPTSRGDRVDAMLGTSAQVPVPGSAGNYEIRYYSFANGATLAALPLTVALRAAMVSAPSSVAAGSIVSVEFNGPRHKEDSLFFIQAGAAENRYFFGNEFNKLASGASPARMTVPATPGKYELRYFSPENGGLLARVPVDVVRPEVTLDAPRLVQRGETFRMRVHGPNAPGDIVFVAEISSPDNRYPGDASQRYKPGPEGRGFLDDDGLFVFDVVAPAQPGSYEIRYMSWQNAAILDRRALLIR